MATYKLSNTAITLLKANADLRNKVMVDQNVTSRQTLYNWINSNDDNLTKASIIKIIRDETGLTDDQILESATHAASIND